MQDSISTADRQSESTDEMIRCASEKPSKPRRSKLMQRDRTQRKKKRSRRSKLASFPLAGGKYRGRPVGDVPVRHLRWMLETRKASEADLWVIRQFLDSQRRGER